MSKLSPPVSPEKSIKVTLSEQVPFYPIKLNFVLRLESLRRNELET